MRDFAALISSISRYTILISRPVQVYQSLPLQFPLSPVMLGNESQGFGII